VTFKKAIATATETLISGATLDELKAAVDDLRALSPGSALADLVRAKINQIATEDDDERNVAAGSDGSAIADEQLHETCDRQEE
jgi:hypothetical protein